MSTGADLLSGLRFKIAEVHSTQVKNPVPVEKGQKPSPSEKRSKTQSLFLFKNPVPRKAWFKNPVPAENTVKNPVAQKPSRSRARDSAVQKVKNPVPRLGRSKNPVREGLGF